MGRSYMRDPKIYKYLTRELIKARQGVDGYGGDIIINFRHIQNSAINDTQKLEYALDKLKDEEVAMGAGRGFEKIITGFTVNEDCKYTIHGTKTDRLKKFLQQLLGRDKRRNTTRIVGELMQLTPVPANDWSRVDLLIDDIHMRIHYINDRGEKQVILPDITCDQLGLGGRERNQIKPGKIWQLLMDLAGRNGVGDISDNEGEGALKRQYKSQLKSFLHEFFKIPKSIQPFRNLSNSRYQANFKISFNHALPEIGSGYVFNEDRDSRLEGMDDVFQPRN